MILKSKSPPGSPKSSRATTPKSPYDESKDSNAQQVKFVLEKNRTLDDNAHLMTSILDTRRENMLTYCSFKKMWGRFTIKQQDISINLPHRTN